MATTSDPAVAPGFTDSATGPRAVEIPFTSTAHGDTRIDPFSWLRSDTKDDPAVLALLAAENAFTATMTAHTEVLQGELFDEMKARIKEDDLSVPSRKHGWWQAFRTAEGRQYGEVVRRRDDGTGIPAMDSDGWETVLDEDALAGKSPYFSLGLFDISPSSDLVLFGTDYDGSELHTLHVRDLRTGDDLPDLIEGAYYGSAWAGDDMFFYVTTDDAMRPNKVWRHALGTVQTDDVCIFEETDERFFLGVGDTNTDRYVLVESGSKVTTEIWVLDVADPTGQLVCLGPREQDVEYSVAHAPTASDPHRFVITTNADGATDFKVMTARPGEGRASWVEVVPTREGVTVSSVEAFANNLVRYERSEGLRRIVVTTLDVSGALAHEHVIEMPEPVYAAGRSANPEYATGVLRFGYTSLVTPSSIYEYDMTTRQRVLLKETPVLGPFDRTDYETGRTWAKADDDTLVPVSWVRKIGAPAPGPVLLYGYGSYETCIDPTFSILRLSLLDRGVTFAIAHVRGGGEMGRRWYDDGKMLTKQHTFTDFIAAARHLVAEGFADPTKIVARGGSAGGLLMGAITNLAPSEFAGIVAEVPFVDCLSTILDPTLPLTVTEWEEWGNPVASADIYACMREYSPYDNVTDGTAYPAILATAGLNDPRVSYWEPAKWVQKLRTATTSARPVLLKTEMGAGHGGPSGRYDAWKDEAFVHAFILDTLGLA